MALKLTNNAVSRLSGNITSASVTISLIPVEGARFPTLADGDWFPATLISPTGSTEIVRVTARSTDVLTVVRAQESTFPQSFSAGDRIELRLTAAATLDGTPTADDFNDLQQDVEAIYGAFVLISNLLGNARLPE